MDNTLNETWKPGEGKELKTAILFVDLISSSDFASVLDLRTYAEYADYFERLRRKQCQHFFQVLHSYHQGLDYETEIVGDELVVFLHTDNAVDDVYQLICLAITLKCGWLGMKLNRQRMASGMTCTQLAAGIHYGPVWARWDGKAYHKRGFAINVAKRAETISRNGEYFRIFVTDPAFKQINRRLRNILFAPRRIMDMKGVVLPTATHEIVDSFINPMKRLAPQFQKNFTEVAKKALASDTFDLWIHSCLQISEESRTGLVTDECLSFCQHILNIDQKNAVALYYAAQGTRERGDADTAKIYLEELTSHWPMLADGWLELGKLLKNEGDKEGARHVMLQARRYGICSPEKEIG